MSFRPTDLFGGAIIANLPVSFGDVSDIRQVPDNQEVFLDPQGFSSISVEILERVEKNDTEALHYHLHDVVEEDANQTKIIATSDAVFTKLPSGFPAYTLSALMPPGEKQRGRANEPDFVLVLLVLLRLAEQKTDILVSINAPFVAGQYDKDTINPDAGNFGPLGTTALSYRDKILQTLEIKDWDLFVNE